MEILKELRTEDRESLIQEIRGHPHEGDMKNALARKYCYRVRVFPEDFSRILINSSTEDRHLELGEYPSLEEVIASISEDAVFLDATRMDGRLSGTKVKEYLEAFLNHGCSLDRIFLLDRNEYLKMNPGGEFYVRDGMHRLVAFGLASGMNTEHFPIYGYYCRNDPLGA